MSDIIRFRGVDKKRIADEQHTADYLAAEQYKKVYLGQLALYYKDLWRKICVPYDYISRAYRGTSVVMPDDHPAIEYFRLILVHDGKEFANIIMGEGEKYEELTDRLVLKIHELHPETEIGYIDADNK